MKKLERRDGFLRGGRGVFPCASCGKSTRQTRETGDSPLCLPCFDAAGIENAHSDGMHEGHPEPACPECQVGVVAPGLPRGVCERCGEEAAEVRISATTLDGEVLDFSVACRGCARDAGFEIGGVIVKLVDELKRYLRMLVDLYVMNQGTDSQFVACRTPGGNEPGWDGAMKLLGMSLHPKRRKAKRGGCGP